MKVKGKWYWFCIFYSYQSILGKNERMKVMRFSEEDSSRYCSGIDLFDE
jgi:hypothetical protein